MAIQGFGNVGSSIAQALYKEGFKITAISDAKGDIRNEQGFNILKLLGALKGLERCWDVIVSAIFVIPAKL